jgi:hypothetical protein
MSNSALQLLLPYNFKFFWSFTLVDHSSKKASYGGKISSLVKWAKTIYKEVISLFSVWNVNSENGILIKELSSLKLDYQMDILNNTLPRS